MNDFDRPTRSGRPTARPPSTPDEDAEIIDLDGDARVLLGKVMAGQAKLVKSHAGIKRSFDSIERAWDARSRDHETAMREVNGFSKCIREMREEMNDLIGSSKKTSKTVSTAARAIPAVLVVIEVVRGVLVHYKVLG